MLAHPNIELQLSVAMAERVVLDWERGTILLDGVRSRADLGAEVAPDLYEAELFYLRRHEWALTADDVLWRRSKLGLHFSAAEREAVARWMAARGLDH